MRASPRTVWKAIGSSTSPARGTLTGRTRHGLLTIPAVTGADGIPLVDGHPWDSIHARELVQFHAGPAARLVADTTPERFDVLNLLVATDGSVKRYDIRRLRPNLVLSGFPADIEPDLPGHALAIGDALIGVHSRKQRCIVTSIDPDSGEQNLDVFRRIRDDFGGQMALTCWVIKHRVVQVDDPVSIVPAPSRPKRVGGWIVGAPHSHHAR